MSFETPDKASTKHNSSTDEIEENLNSPLAFSGQLSLGLELSNKLTLDNFIIGQNKAILNFINSLILSSKKNSKTNYNPDKCLYLYGASGTGKTHLLQSICHQATQNQLSAIYLDAKAINPEQMNQLNDMEYLEVICIDNIDAITGSDTWELAFFHLFNRVYTSGASLIMASKQKPKQLDIKLPDLLSRLQWVLAFKLNPLNDEDLILAIEDKFSQKGFYVSKDVISFMIHRLARKVTGLMDKVDLLCNLAISKKRKITIPFVKKMFNI